MIRKSIEKRLRISFLFGVIFSITFLIITFWDLIWYPWLNLILWEQGVEDTRPIIYYIFIINSILGLFGIGLLIYHIKLNIQAQKQNRLMFMKPHIRIIYPISVSILWIIGHIHIPFWLYYGSNYGYQIRWTAYLIGIIPSMLILLVLFVLTIIYLDNRGNPFNYYCPKCNRKTEKVHYPKSPKFYYCYACQFHIKR